MAAGLHPPVCSWCSQAPGRPPTPPPAGSQTRASARVVHAQPPSCPALKCFTKDQYIMFIFCVILTQNPFPGFMVSWIRISNTVEAKCKYILFVISVLLWREWDSKSVYCMRRKCANTFREYSRSCSIDFISCLHNTVFLIYRDTALLFLFWENKQNLQELCQLSPGLSGDVITDLWKCRLDLATVRVHLKKYWRF